MHKYISTGHCKECRADYQRRWRAGDPERATAYTAAANAKRRRELEQHDYVSASHCRDCGNAYRRQRRILEVQRDIEGHPYVSSTHCNQCSAAYMREWTQRPGNREKQLSRKREYYRRLRVEILDKDVKRKYGLSSAEYRKLLDAQDGRCAICKRTPEEVGRFRRLDVDHDHGTGKVRGLLCAWCNRGIGMFADDAALLLSAVAYLS